MLSTNSKNKIIEDILDAREKRTLFLKSKLNGQTLVISFSLNIPGENKKDKNKRIFIEKYFYEYLKNINKITNTSSYDMIEDANGYVYYIYLCLSSINPLDVKKDSLKFENSIGVSSKLIDIDIYEAIDKKISRQDLAKPARECFVCEKKAKECAFLQTHSEKELNLFVEKIINSSTPFVLSEEFIFSDIVRKITEGQILEEDHLKEEELSNAYNVSRTKIREVIKKLQEFNLVNLKKHIGAEIKKLDPNEINEILTLRIVLKKIIFKDIFENYNDKNYFILEDIKNRISLIGENNYELKAIWNIDFHKLLFLISTKEYTKNLLNKLDITFASIHRKINNKILVGEFNLLNDFEQICDSIIKRDKERLDKVTRIYFEKIRNVILSF